MVEIGHDEVVEFEKTRGRQDVICVVRRIGLEKVDRDLQQVSSLQCAAQASLVGARRGDVVVPGEERPRLCGFELVGKVHMADRPW